MKYEWFIYCESIYNMTSTYMELLHHTVERINNAELAGL